MSPVKTKYKIQSQRLFTGPLILSPLNAKDKLPKSKGEGPPEELIGPLPRIPEELIGPLQRTPDELIGPLPRTSSALWPLPAEHWDRVEPDVPENLAWTNASRWWAEVPHHSENSGPSTRSGAKHNPSQSTFIQAQVRHRQT